MENKENKEKGKYNKTVSKPKCVKGG